MKSLAELGRLNTLTSESNWDEFRSSASFPQPKLLAHEQTMLKRDRLNQTKKTGIPMPDL